jgi:hypothetical protein
LMLDYFLIFNSMWPIYFFCVRDSVVIIDDDDGHVEDHGGEVRADTPAKACMWHKMKDQASPAYFVP